MKHRRLRLNAFHIKRRSIEIFDRENDFTDINEFKEYINVHKPSVFTIVENSKGSGDCKIFCMYLSMFKINGILEVS